ncbi:hypothetical protein GBA65_21795 (plasmid) [Rubrobacter marinus]|uniref:Uncharacterized protein n=1 Tax=Rubrobacter marinus TaxID=2653852 RepID=A0A6G8Q3P0_9ACTN|nr:hypothetical protein [Rubrobacter marinus]QIN81073.1 hypothetical protein GBA65_21795 [Rubrobacter marinus]
MVAVYLYAVAGAHVEVCEEVAGTRGGVEDGVDGAEDVGDEPGGGFRGKPLLEAHGRGAAAVLLQDGAGGV